MVTVMLIVDVAHRTVPKRLEKRLEGLEIGGRINTIQTIAFLRLAKSTEKSPGDPRRLGVIQTTVKDHQQTLVRKAVKKGNYYYYYHYYYYYYYY